MFSLKKDLPMIPGRPGVTERRPKHDPNVLTVEEWTFDPGVEFGAHAHEESQITYIAEGKLRLRQGDKEFLLEAGCYYYTPAGTVHQIAEIIEKTTMVVVGTAKKS